MYSATLSKIDTVGNHSILIERVTGDPILGGPDMEEQNNIAPDEVNLEFYELIASFSPCIFLPYHNDNPKWFHLGNIKNWQTFFIEAKKNLLLALWCVGICSDLPFRRTGFVWSPINPVLSSFHARDKIPVDLACSLIDSEINFPLFTYIINKLFYN